MHDMRTLFGTRPDKKSNLMLIKPSSNQNFHHNSAISCLWTSLVRETCWSSTIFAHSLPLVLENSCRGCQKKCVRTSVVGWNHLPLH